MFMMVYRSLAQLSFELFNLYILNERIDVKVSGVWTRDNLDKGPFII